jgi:hypothetical protein
VGKENHALRCLLGALARHSLGVRRGDAALIGRHLSMLAINGLQRHPQRGQVGRNELSTLLIDGTRIGHLRDVHKSLLCFLCLLLSSKRGLFSPPDGQSDRVGAVAMLPQLCGDFASMLTESLGEACREHFHAAILPCHKLGL